MRRIALLLLLLTACAPAWAREEQWFSVHLDGLRIGHMLQTRTLDSKGHVVSRQRLSLTLQRSGEALTIESDELAHETRDGQPLSFETRIDSAGTVTQARGRIFNGSVLQVDVEQGGAVQRHDFTWPEGALLAEGQRLAGINAGFLPGTQYTMQAFDPGSLRAARVLVRVGAIEPVAIHDTAERLLPLQQTMWLDGAAIESQLWLEPSSGMLRRLRFPAIGLNLDVLACDRACALAPVQPADVLSAMLVPAPRVLQRADLDRPLQYRLTLKQGDGAALGVPPGQRLLPLEDGAVQLQVDPAGDARNPPHADDTAATRWLQADADEVIALARKAVGTQTQTRERMRLLESFVRDYITVKSLRVAYATATEVIRDREGDCTEHAVLLAALARALDIPARVATGIAYSPAYGERQNVFVPHAWVLAWVDGRWQGFDAALEGFGAGHIAFSAGDGDPFRFYTGFELLGSVNMLDVERMGWRERGRMRRALTP